MARQALRAEGLLPVRGQPGAHDQSPLAAGTAQVPYVIRPVHLLARRTPPPAGGDPVVPLLPQSYGATHPASDSVAVVRSGVAARGGVETVVRRRGYSEFPAHHSRYQVLQISAGSHQRGFDEGAE